MTTFLFSCRFEYRVMRLGVLLAAFAFAAWFDIGKYLLTIACVGAVLLMFGAFLRVVPETLLEDLMFLDQQVNHAFKCWALSHLPLNSDEREVAFHTLDHVLEKWGSEAICYVMTHRHAIIWLEYVRDRSPGLIHPKSKYAEIWRTAYPKVNLFP